MKRNGQTVNAHNVDTEVAFISWPDQTELGDDFVYDDTAGTGVTVYIVDTGAGLANNDVSSLFTIGGDDTTDTHLGIFQICRYEQKIPPSPRCEPKRWPGK